MINRMEISKSQTEPAPPNIISALRAGFDAVANQIILITFPIILDLWVWLGPHLQIKQLLTKLIETVVSSPGFTVDQTSGLLPITPESLAPLLARINLMTFLRSYPIGIPSLMAGSLPIETPVGQTLLIDFTSPVMVIVVWVGLTVFGLYLGTFYFCVVSQAALSGHVQWRQAVKEWPQAFSQVLLLTLSLGIFLLLVSLPLSCVISVLAMGGLPLGQFGIFIYLGFLVWLIFPLLFAPHGIISNRLNLLASVRKSAGLTRLAMPPTALLVFTVLLISQGLDILWRVPAETSWLTLIGVAGHAFVATSLLAATFIYYRDASRWTENIIQKMRKPV